MLRVNHGTGLLQSSDRAGGQPWDGVCVYVTCMNERVFEFPCCHGEDLPSLSFIHGSGLVLRSDSGVDSFETSQRINCYGRREGMILKKKKKAHIKRFINNAFLLRRSGH